MNESVIVAHGLWMPGAETVLLRRRLRSAGFTPRLFRFPTLRGTLRQNADRLARFAAAIDAERMHFVGYSLGGVVVLTMLTVAGETSLPNLGRVVCLGSPLAGSGTAAKLAGGRLGRLGRRMVGRSLLEHTAQGGIERWDGNAELGLIAGSRNLGVGRLVRGVRGTGDGTVAVAETELPGATAHITLPVTHTQLLFDAEVARKTIQFLRHGRFG